MRRFVPTVPLVKNSTRRAAQKKPEPVAFTVSEGSYWIDWELRSHIFEHCKTQRIQGELFAIKFSDGSIFDFVVGWRRDS